MHRETKYRGQRVDTKEWIYGYLIKCGITGKSYIFPYGNDANESDKVGEEGCLRLVTFEVIPETVGQYTGLKDRNGKEIYEGDIVEYGGPQYLEIYRALIKYKDDRYIADWIGDVSLRKDIHFWTTEREIQVIGNIYDNPELLQEADNGSNR